MQKTQINSTQLGTTGLEITRVGFGAWALGGAGYDWGWGAQDDDDSIAAIHQGSPFDPDDSSRFGSITALPPRPSGAGRPRAHRARGQPHPRVSG